jgi:hypothetical protein
MKRTVLCLLAVHFALIPCFADVIPSRRQESNRAAEQTVKSRLEQMGVSSTEAEQQVRDLTSKEIAYFGANPDRVQMAGSLYWYEWVAGAAVAIIITGTIIALKIELE